MLKKSVNEKRKLENTSEKPIKLYNLKFKLLEWVYAAIHT